MNPLLALHGELDPVAFGTPSVRHARDLRMLSAKVAQALPSSGRGAYVVLACHDRYYFAAGLLAAWSRGLSVALPANGQPETVHALLAHSKAEALLHDQDGGQGIDLRSVDALPGDARDLALSIDRDDVAIVAFTSGSTGEPQAHPKTWAQLFDETSALIECFGLEGARVLSAVPAQHIYGLLFGVLVPLLSGGAMSRSSPLLPADLLSCVKRERADVLVAVPPHLRALMGADVHTLTSLRRVFSSGALLPNEVAGELFDAGVVVTQVFGSTETGGIAYRERAFAPFRPLPRVTCSRSAQGALCVDSPWLSAKVARPMETQDRVELVPEGFLHLGRLDSVVKVGGRRIDLGDLETTLKQIAGVRDARVLAESGDAARGTALLCVVEADSLTPEEVRKQLGKRVDPVVVPKRMRIVASLPRNAMGKVTREALLALFDTLTCPQETTPEGTLRFQIPAHLGFLRGHFDGQPILPGVVQLHYLALREARKRWPDLQDLVRTSRVKFKRPIVPGEELTLSLARKRTTLVEFQLSVGTETASSGLFHFEDAAQVGAVHE